jgi:hypothetical protein
MELLQTLVGLLSIGLGPYVSGVLPAMAPGLRPWSQWLSLIAAVMGFAAGTYVAKRKPKIRMRVAIWGAVGTFGFAFAYFLINLLWTSQFSDWRDDALRASLVLSYVLTAGGLTLVVTTFDVS